MAEDAKYSAQLETFGTMGKGTSITLEGNSSPPQTVTPGGGGWSRNLETTAESHSPLVLSKKLKSVNLLTSIPLAEFSRFFNSLLLTEPIPGTQAKWFILGFLSLLEQKTSVLLEEESGRFWTTLTDVAQATLGSVRKNESLAKDYLNSLTHILFHQKAYRKWNEAQRDFWNKFVQDLLQVVAGFERVSDLGHLTLSQVIRMTLFQLESVCVQTPKGNPERETIFWTKFDQLLEKFSQLGLINNKDPASQDSHFVQRSALLTCSIMLCLGDSKTLSISCWTLEKFDRYSPILKSFFQSEEHPNDDFQLDHWVPQLRTYLDVGKYQLAFLGHEERYDSRFLKGLAEATQRMIEQADTLKSFDPDWISKSITKLKNSLRKEKTRALFVVACKNLFLTWVKLFECSHLIEKHTSLLWWNIPENATYIQHIYSDPAHFKLFQDDNSGQQQALLLMLDSLMKLSSVFCSSYFKFPPHTVQELWKFTLRLFHLLRTKKVEVNKEKKSFEVSPLLKSYYLSGLVQILPKVDLSNAKDASLRTELQQVITSLTDQECISAGCSKPQLLSLMKETANPKNLGPPPMEIKRETSANQFLDS